MSLNVTPGSVVTVTITRNPRSERAAKTLSRLFGGDVANRKKARTRGRILAQTAEQRRRGGRLWTVKSKAPRLLQPRPGDTCKLHATVQVLRDLDSVQSCIELAPAGKR